MPVPVICSCSAKLRVGDHLRGQQIQCPKCGSIHSISETGKSVANGKPPPAPAKAKPRPAGPLPKLAEVLEKSGLVESKQKQIEDKLEEGEVLLWAGEPLPFYKLIVTLFAMVPAVPGVILVVVAIVLPPDLPVALRLVLGVLGGLALGAGILIPLYFRHRYNKQIYAVSTRRAMIWEWSFGGMKFKDYDAADLSRLETHPVGSKGAGHLYFAIIVKKTKGGRVTGMKAHGFFYIDKHDEVNKLIRTHLVDPHTEALYS